MQVLFLLNFYNFLRDNVANYLRRSSWDFLYFNCQYYSVFRSNEENPTDSLAQSYFHSICISQSI